MSTPTPPVPGPNAPAEPVITAGLITAGVTALLAVIAAFVAPFTDDQQAAILGLVAVVAPVVAAVWARRKAWSPDSVRRLVKSLETPAPLPTTERTVVKDLIRDDKGGADQW